MDKCFANIKASENDGYFGVPKFVVGFANIGISPNQRNQGGSEE
jgi:hypothetical protein